MINLSAEIKVVVTCHDVITKLVMHKSWEACEVS